MVLLYLLIIAALIILVLLFNIASKIFVHFDSASTELNFTLLWLYPFLKSVIESENDTFTLSIYIFSKRIFKKQLANHKAQGKNKNLLSKINPTDIHINARYGFSDPYFTGLAFAALNMMPRFLSLESLHQRPDFLVSSDFINIDATAKLNLGRFLLKLV